MLRGAGTVPGLALGLLIRVLRPLDSLDMLVQVFVCISVPLFCFSWLFVYGIEEKPHLMSYSVYSASAPRSARRPGYYITLSEPRMPIRGLQVITV